MIRLRPSGADEVLIKRVQDWYEPGPGVFIAHQALFNPALLFTTGVNGVWYDPSDFSTMFQDAAGTTPVTAVGQPVGRLLDKSGRGNHAFNPSGNSANFPVLQQDGTGRYYLAVNGVNQWLQTNSIDFTYGDKMFVAAGVRKLSDAASGVLLETSYDFGLNNGSIVIRAPRIAGASQYNIGIRISAAASVDAATYTAPISSIVSAVLKSSSISISDAISVRVNSATPISLASTGSTPGTGNYGNYPLYIGARAGSSLWFNGRLYGLVVAGKQASASEIAGTETWLNQKTGAY